MNTPATPRYTEYGTLAPRLTRSPRYRRYWYGDLPMDDAICSYLMERVFRTWLLRPETDLFRATPTVTEPDAHVAAFFDNYAAGWEATQPPATPFEGYPYTVYRRTPSGATYVGSYDTVAEYTEAIDALVREGYGTRADFDVSDDSEPATPAVIVPGKAPSEPASQPENPYEAEDTKDEVREVLRAAEWGIFGWGDEHAAYSPAYGTDKRHAVYLYDDGTFEVHDFEVQADDEPDTAIYPRGSIDVDDLEEYVEDISAVGTPARTYRKEPYPKNRRKA